MFTIQQIQLAHSNVKTGADFPKFMQELIYLGVTSFETFVTDNHTNYFGRNNFQIQSEGYTSQLNISNQSNKQQFTSDLKSHQEGNTDYLTFLNDCAKSGVEKWVVNVSTMTCSYYDKAGNELLVEKIPTV